MSSPTGRSETTRSQDSAHSSSQYATGAAWEDTASSAAHPRTLPGRSTTVSPSVAPNSAYVQWRSLTRGRSASPRPRRIASPIGVSDAQRRAQMAEQIAESAFSGVGQVADETRRAREVAEAAIAEARSVHGAVESRVAALSARADESTTHAVEVLTEQMRQTAAETEAKASRTVGTVVQQLEKEITAAAMSAAATAEVTTRTMVEGVKRDVQAQMDKNRADTLHRADEAQRKVEQVSNELRELTIQLNAFKPASAQTVREEQKVLSDKFQQQSAQQNKVYEEVQQQLGAHNVRIDQLSDSVKQSQKTAQETAELMQTLLVGMENLGEHFKQLQAEMENWKSPEFQETEREYAELNKNLLKEVSLTVPAVTEPPNVAGSPSVIPTPVFAAPEIAGSPSVSAPVTTRELDSMGLHAEWVQGTALQRPYPGAPPPPATKGFNLGEKGQDQQAKIPQFFKCSNASLSLKLETSAPEYNKEKLE